MEDWVNFTTDFFNSYIKSFKNITEDQNKNFEIKREHSFRVAKITGELANALNLSKKDRKIAFLTGLLHDIGRFSQLVEYNTFYDAKSVDHAEYSVKVLKKEDILNQIGCSDYDLIFQAIQLHNKFEVPKKMTNRELLHSQLLRDADKLDILKVLTEYYSNRNSEPNHTLTWELPKGTSVSPLVAKEILAGKLVSKKEVVSEIDVKIMQLSWVFDLNFIPSFKYLIEKRFMEKIFDSLPKNDLIIEIYRKVKVFSENKLFANAEDNPGFNIKT